MLGLLIATAVLVTCAVTVLVLCAGTRSADDTAADLSRLDHLDGVRDEPDRQPVDLTRTERPERVA